MKSYHKLSNGVVQLRVTQTVELNALPLSAGIGGGSLGGLGTREMVARAMLEPLVASALIVLLLDAELVPVGMRLWYHWS